MFSAVLDTPKGTAHTLGRLTVWAHQNMEWPSWQQCPLEGLGSLGADSVLGIEVDAAG